MHMRSVHQGQETNDRDAVTWLADTFGRDRAIAATVVHTEQHAGALIRAHEHSRALAQMPDRELQHEQSQVREHDHGRSTFSR
jgi:hypothetical protein